MIRNERQYRITRAQAERFEQALQSLPEEQDENIHPLLRQAEEAGLRSQLEDLRHELEEYERLRSGEVGVLTVEGWGDIPKILIQARIASGLTQRELADRVGLHAQQIQRYEAIDYLEASFERIREVADALDLELYGLAAGSPDMKQVVAITVRKLAQRLGMAAARTGMSAENITEVLLDVHDASARTMRLKAWEDTPFVEPEADNTVFLHTGERAYA
ncbi:MAG: helix-turn-helix domain-containing protein [Ardenticatenaceae bacterium]|nr:helix-turn-helix domain-containing protein [Ardenticatenaceae bacterium]HBY97862.1 hypothetical protein [Chloroflexota bacterium]